MISIHLYHETHLIFNIQHLEILFESDTGYKTKYTVSDGIIIRGTPPPQPPVSELTKNFLTKNVPKTGQNRSLFRIFVPEANNWTLGKKMYIF